MINPTPEGVLSSIEVMDTENKRWCREVLRLPTSFTDMKAAIVGDLCYFMGGCIEGSGHRSGRVATDRVFSISLSALIPQATATSSRMVWNEITARFFRSTPLSLGGSLLALGGKMQGGQATPAIYRYQPQQGWSKVGDLSISRFNCACALMSGGSVVIVGGCHDRNKMKRMDIA